MDFNSQRTLLSNCLTPIPVRETQYDNDVHATNGAVGAEGVRNDCCCASSLDDESGQRRPASFNEHDVAILMRVLEGRNIIIEHDAARLLLQEAWKNGEFNNQLIDQFYAQVVESSNSYCEQTSLNSPFVSQQFISFESVTGLLAQVKANNENISVVDMKPTKILNVFHDIKREVWDFQQQVGASSLPSIVSYGGLVLL